MSPSTPPRPPSANGNTLLNLLNPYSSMSRSVYPKEPESPSTMLLRELQGEDDTDDSDKHEARPSYGEASRDGSTPSASLSRSKAPEASATAHSDSDDDGPSRSLLYGTGDRTPRSPPTPLPQRTLALPRPMSPGPFQPPSSSASGRSRSTSPGPSSISIYASGLDGIEASNSSAGASRDHSTSPVAKAGKSARPVTFRAPPTVRPAPPVRNTSASSKVASPRPAPGYLDPSILEPGSGRSASFGKAKDKGKGKERNQGGRRYVSIAAEEDEVDDLDQVDEGVRPKPKAGLNEYEKSLWRWVNVEDLDGYLQEVYAYYKGKGFVCIILARFLNLVTTFFVIGFSTFLFSCVDYTKLNSELSGPNAIGRLDDVLIGQCLSSGSFTHMLFLFSVGMVYLFQLASFLMSIPRLMDMYRFYTHLLGIPDADIQTLPWPEIVRLIGEIRKHNPVTSLSNGQADALAELTGEEADRSAIKKLDAHDVANRILRQENYLIALFNKDLLDLRVRFPVPHSLIAYVPPSLLAPPLSQALPSTQGDKRERSFISFGKNTLTKALEWNLRFCLMGYLFDERGQVRKEFVREKRRKDLVEGLKRRFIFMAVLNAIFAPFIVIYLLIYSFFRYFDEFHKNPSSIGSRQYTPYAQWKFREFNELPHLFERRLNRSYPTAKEYNDQFPKERTALIMRFVAFVAGSFAAVLLVASLIDPDLFLHFEITPHRTVLFYLGLFGGVLAVARGMIPEENLVFDPEMSLREVVKWTHYLPGEWHGKLHSQMVHQEFGTLFSMKIGIFFQELLSVLLTPFILFFSLPPCAGAIIDFFREFTVHVEGVGYVCSFAVFDFRRHGTGVAESNEDKNPSTRIKSHAQDDKSRANENKMEKSFLHFKATHPDWIPDQSSSVFLDKLVGAHQRSTMGGSVHAGGGRGLGIGGVASTYDRGWGMEESQLRERSRSYDRAWAKSSHLLKSQSRRGVNGSAERGKVSDIGMRDGRTAGASTSHFLPPLNEEEDLDRPEDYDEGGQDGWENGKRAIGEDEDDDERGFLRDVGVVGILQQIITR